MVINDVFGLLRGLERRRICPVYAMLDGCTTMSSVILPTLLKLQTQPPVSAPSRR